MLAAAGAARLMMPEVPAQQYAEALLKLVAANHQWVPPAGKGSLYLRPLLLGTGPVLGLNPAPSYTFLAFAADVGAYFKVRHCGVLSPCCPADPAGCCQLGALSMTDGLPRSIWM